MGGVIGQAREIHQRFKFLVKIDGVENFAFQSCEGLDKEFATTEYWAGGSIIADKQPARLTVSDITLERGVATGDSDLYNWFLEVGDAAANAGIATPGYKRNFTIDQLDRTDAIAKSWTVYGAWVKKFVPGAWDNTSDDPTVEQVVLACDYWQLTYQKTAD